MGETLLSLLQEALKLEDDGRSYYLDVAQRTRNPLARRTFEVLADEEAKHRSYVEAYYRAQERCAEGPSMAAVGVESITQTDRARNVFEEAARHAHEAVTEETHLQEAYVHATELERKSIEFYQAMLAKADDANIVQFLEFLVDQERHHLELLSRTQDFISDPATWFFDEEKWTVEG